MALLNCLECGKKVSTDADACPKCGAPPPKSMKGEVLTAKQSSAMTYKQRRAFQKAGGKILLSTGQKFGFMAIGLSIVFGLAQCSSTNRDTLEPITTNDEQVEKALRQIENAMKDPRKLRLMECNGINPWETKPVGWTSPTKSECVELDRVLEEEAKARQ